MSELSQLTEEQRSLLEILLREEGKDPDLVLPIPRRLDRETAPLSPAQERMWFAWRMAPADASYNIQTALRIAGSLDVPRLQSALDRLMERHETLRTSFGEHAGAVFQRIHPPGPCPLVRLAIPSQAELQTYVEAEAHRRWDLTVAPSLRATLIACGRDHVLLLGMHHILSDGWSVGVLVRDLWRLYEDAGACGVMDPQYADYAVWECRRSARDAATHSAFWRGQLQDAFDRLDLPLSHPRQPGAGSRGALHSLALGPDLAQAVRRCAAGLQASPFAVCLAGFDLLLADLTGSTDLLVGTPVINRERSDLEDLVGYFANTVVLRSEWGPGASFADLVHQVRDRSIGALAHQAYPFEKLVEALNPRRVPGANPLFQVFFAFQKYTLDRLQASGLEIAEFEHHGRVTRFDLELHAWENGSGGIDAVFVYAADLFDPATVAAWAARWTRMLAQACAAPGAPVADLCGGCATPWETPGAIIELARASMEQAVARVPGVTGAVALVHQAPAQDIPRLPVGELLPLPAKRAKATPGAAAPAAPLPRSPRDAITHGAPFELDPAGPQTLADLLLRAAADHPEHGCRFLPSGVFVTYPQLLDDTRRAQTWLQECGVVPVQPLLLQLTDERDILTCFWAAVLAGAIPFILPVPDGFHPDAGTRLTATWKHLGCPPVVVGQTAPEWTGPCKVLPWLPAHWQRCQPAAHPHPALPDDIAFFAQSSGTTGQPKCIPLRHRNALSRALASLAFTRLDATHVSLNWLPLDHIGSISDWHLRCVAAGANPIYAGKQPILADPLTWLDWIEQHGVTDTWAPNFAYNLLIDALESRGRRWDLSRLRNCLTAAEGISCTTLDRLEDLLADSGFRLGVFQPAFGMAEVVSGITYHRPVEPARVPRRSARGDSRAVVDCGAPIPGVSIRIVDDAGVLLREDEPGHFQLRGAPLFPGYHNLPEHNAARFTDDGWFDTGDFAFLHEGHLYVTGREAGEIVSNGRKLSCEDIERTLSGTPGVLAECVVACSVRDGDALRVVLFFSPRDGADAAGVACRITGTVAGGFGLRVDHLVPVEPHEIVRTSIGKLQRSVMGRQFEEGRFRSRVLSPGSGETVRDCFFRQEWRRTRLPAASAPGRTFHVIRGPMAEGVAAALREAGHVVNWLEGLPEGDLPDEVEVIDFSLCREPGAEAVDSYRARETAGHLRLLLGALIARQPRRCRLTVITCQAQVTGRETAVQTGDAVASGILKSAVQECAGWLECRHVDVSAASDSDLAVLLGRELASDAAEAEVAYRGLRRFTPSLARVDLRRCPTGPDVFRPGGFYVVTGGMGGMGRVLCDGLIDQYGLRLLILGRSAPGESHRAYLAARPGAAYATADVADGPALRRIVEQYEQQWELPLSGILHLAGVGGWETQQADPESHRLGHLQPDEFDDQFRAKIDGTQRLYDLVRSRPGAVFIGASSVLGVFGGAGFAAYSAANSYLGAFCRARRAGGDNGVFCLHWASWEGTGMSRGQSPALAAAQGYLSLPPSEGWHAFLAAIHRGQHDLVIGLDPNHPRSGIARTRISVFYTAADTKAAASGVEPLLQGRDFPCPVELRWTEAIPADPQALLAASTVAEAAPTGAPEVESQLLRLFQNALSQKAMNPEDNFFELGAHSLLLARLEGEIQRQVSPKIVLLDLFRFPTVRSLARYIAAEVPAPVSAAPSRADRGQGRDALRQARERHRGRQS